MTVLFHVDWQYGTLSGGAYTMATPEIPNGNADGAANGGESIVVENNSPWNGQSLFDASGNWDDGIEWNALTSSHVPATQGRMLFEFDGFPADADETSFVVIQSASDPSSFTLRIRRQEGTPDWFQIQLGWNSDGNLGEVNTTTLPSGAWTLELIYDTTNSTANLRLRARTWAVGGSPGSFVNSDQTFGSAATTAQPTAMLLDDPGNGDGRLRYGRIIISDDITEDLSTWTPGGGGIALPRHHRSTLLRM